MAHPNFLYIHSHDTGRCVQPYGYAVPTPAMQRLAEQGVLFRQAFCAAPTCSASRAALLTGQCPHSAGILGLAHRGFQMRDFSPHLVRTLRTAGYVSALAGIQHVAKSPEDIGYDHVLNRNGPAEAVAAQFLRSAAERPFFLDVGFFETHRYSGKEGGHFTRPGPSGDPRYVRPPAHLPDTAHTRQDWADFAVSAGTLDAKIGQVLAALAETNHDRNTLVICTTDHGVPFPGAKCTLSDNGLGVMLILRGPGGFEGGRVCDGMVSHIDLFPTICDLAGLTRPAWLQGHSLLPLLDGQAQVNEEVFGEVTYHAAYEPMRCVRTTRWKYVRRFGGRTHRVMPNCDDGLSRREWLDAGWRQAPVAPEDLYDLVLEPTERANLVADPSAAGVLQDMRRRLEEWMRRTDDPLLKGPVPAPPGAEVNDPDGLSPNEPTRRL